MANDIIVGLMQKGISKEDIQVAYSAILEQEGENSSKDEVEAAERALTKRLGRKSINDVKRDPKEMQRLMAYLVRRGFSYDIVKKAMQRATKEE